MMTMMTKALDALKIAGSTRGSALGFPANSGGGGVTGLFGFGAALDAVNAWNTIHSIAMRATRTSRFPIWPFGSSDQIIGHNNATQFNHFGSIDKRIPPLFFFF